MPGNAVIIFSFPEPGPGEDLTFPLLVEKAKPIFEGVKNVKIHAGIKDAADEVVAIFDPPEDGNLVAHAKRELEFLGNDEDFNKSIIDSVRSFAAYGHSGGSAMYAIPVLNDLLQFKNLSPLTNDPNEWIDLDPTDGMVQSTRNPEVFSEDGGKTYYLLSEIKDGEKIFHTAVDKNSRGE